MRYPNEAQKQPTTMVSISMKIADLEQLENLRVAMDAGSRSEAVRRLIAGATVDGNKVTTTTKVAA